MDIQSVKTAKKYARAFLNVFLDQVNVDDFNQICSFSHFLRHHRKSLFFFGLPHISFDEKS